MEKVAHDFEIGSNRVLKGVIGAVDGWLVKIRWRMKIRDKVVRGFTLSPIFLFFLSRASIEDNVSCCSSFLFF